MHPQAEPPLSCLSVSPQGNCPKVSSINDRSDWKQVRKALTVIGFNEDEVEVRTNRRRVWACHTRPARVSMESACFVKEEETNCGLL